MGQVLEDSRLFEEAIFEFVNHVVEFGRLKVEDPHDLDVDRLFLLVGRVIPLRENRTVEEVLVNVADENLNDLVHVVVDYSHSLAPRSAESLHHILNDVLQLLRVRSWLFENFLESLICFGFASIEVFDLS